MKIRRLLAYRVLLPLVEGRYAWSGGKSVDVFDSTIVRIETDTGLVGHGECCPLGPVYLPSYAAGVRAGLAELGPALMGLDPRDTDCVNRRMDVAMKGHPYVKSAVDIACWDILGQSAGEPIVTLLGGRCGETFALYRAISMQSPEEMADRVSAYRSEGYRKFQLKVGADVETDAARIRACAERLEPGDQLVADANTGWIRHQAVRLCNKVRDLDVSIEQPCLTYEECLSVRRLCDLPMVLDECIDGLPSLLRAQQDLGADAVNIKISKFGGLTRARQARDLCVSLGLTVTIEDTWGGDLATAAIAHLAHSTPSEFLFSSTDFNSYVTLDLADDAPRRDGGRLAAPTRPGLGCVPKDSVLGKPLVDISE
jgi:L-alanine-DL-glutamate epimerase-like enolase superfamily enzyme